MEPYTAVSALVKGICSLFGLVVVFCHHSGTGKRYLTLFTIRNLIISSRLYYLVICVRERDAYAAFFGQSGRSKAGCGNALRSAISFAHLDGSLVFLQEGVETLLEFDRERVSAAEHAFEMAEVSTLHVGQTKQSLIEGRNAGHEVAIIFSDEFRITLRSETGH